MYQDGQFLIQIMQILLGDTVEKIEAKLSEIPGGA